VSNVEPLVKYFLFEIYVFHLNQVSKYGSMGKLAIAYGDLISDMYQGDASSLAPWDIKRIISQKANQFMGFIQHDSQEFLSIFLETLHEDVNSITVKPYVEYSDNQNRSDEEIGLEFWSGFKKREQSIFVDLFYGQLKSKLECTKCGKSSLTFDTFNVLSLPIPTQNNISINIKLMRQTLTRENYEFEVSISEYMTFYELNKKIRDFMLQKIYDEKEDTFVAPLVTSVKQGERNFLELEMVLDEKFVKSIGTDSKSKIVVYERESNASLGLKQNEKMNDFILLEIKHAQLKTNFVLFSSL
jgi:hypothetical protein